MTKFSFLSLVFLGLALAGCTGPVLMGTDAAVIYATKPGDMPPADTQSQIPEHESWCYSTMGDPNCYAHPQDVAPGRLINVDPQNRYPLDAQAYHEAVAGKQGISAPTALEPAQTIPVEKVP